MTKKSIFKNNSFIAALSFLMLGMTLITQWPMMQESTANATGFFTIAVTKNSVGVRKSEVDYVTAHHYRVAKRLQKRLAKRRLPTPPVQELVYAIKQRIAYWNNSVTVRFVTQQGEEFSTWHVSLSNHPSWTPLEVTSRSAQTRLSIDRIREHITSNGIEGVVAPENVYLTEVHEDNGVLRAAIEGVATPGHSVDIEILTNQLASALNSGIPIISSYVFEEHGKIVNLTPYDLGNLEYLAGGKSNFKGSSWGRKENVKKALNQHVNNVIIPPGETFSFNDLLGGPVNTSNGWKIAKVIFTGHELKDLPGGGICQASTTVFRAIANAGFPLVDHRNHSLYVHYYEKYGVGLDATIYPGVQDLAFTNDTDEYMVLQAFHSGDDAYVNMYGKDTGRRVSLEGPYFRSNAPEGFTYKGRKLYNSEIAWVQTITYPGGHTEQNTFVSYYKKGIPSYVIKRNALPMQGKELSFNN